MAGFVKVRDPVSGRSIELTEDVNGLLRYSMDGAAWPQVVTTRDELTRYWEEHYKLASTQMLGYELLRRFINQYPCDAEEPTLP